MLFQQEEQLFDAERAKIVLKESIALDPSHLAPCLKLLDVYEFEHDESARNRLLDEMTKRFPGEKTVLLRAGNECLDRKAYGKGLDYLEQAHALDSLDPNILLALFRGYLRHARHCFTKGNLAKGRQSFALAEGKTVQNGIDPNLGRDFLLVRHGILESLFGDKAEGQRLIGEARRNDQGARLETAGRTDRSAERYCLLPRRLAALKRLLSPMEILCPSCGKANQAAPCRRCGCELEPLFAISRAAEAQLAAAATALRGGREAEACDRAAQSWEMRHSPEAARLAFLASIALEDFEAMRLWHGRALPRRAICRTS